MTSYPDHADLAARGILKATIKALGDTPNTGYLVLKEESALWSRLQARARENGITLEVMYRDAVAGMPIAPKIARPCVLWWQEGFHQSDPTSREEGWPAAWERFFDLCVSISYPEGLESKTLTDWLARLHDEALAADPELVERRSAAVSYLIRRSGNLALDYSHERVNLSSACDPRTDFDSIPRDAAILQLPLGESWIPIDSPQFSISLPTLTPGAVEMIHIKQGRVQGHNVCEVGIGTNRASRAIPGTVLPEKALGRLHVGLGDNRLIGGRTKGEFHGDLYLAPEVRLLGRLDGELPFEIAPSVLAPAVIVMHELNGWTHKSLSRGGFMGPIAGSGDQIVECFGEAQEVLWSNCRALESLRDPRSSELICLPGDEVERLGRLSEADPSEICHDLWRVMNQHMGPLPWPYVDIVRTPLVSKGLPRALSVPGAVLLDPSLRKAPLSEKWLYISHELVHQWLGGMVRIGSVHGRDWEAVCEGLAHRVSQELLGPVAASAFSALRDRQRDHSCEAQQITDYWALTEDFGSKLNELCKKSMEGVERLQDVPLSTITEGVECFQAR